MVVLLFVGEVRRPTAIGLGVSLVAIVGWYAPHLGEVRSASQIEDGVQIGFPWVVTAPIDQILLPALLWIDGTALVAGVVWLPLVLLAIAVIASSPLVHDRVQALLLGSGVVVTVVTLWIAQAYVIPRYLSYLLVPLFILLATGAASILSRITERRAVLRTVVCLVVLVVLAVRFAIVAPDVVALPREAHRDAAEVIQRRGTSTPVVAYMRNPGNLAFYLDRPVLAPEPRQRGCPRLRARGRGVLRVPAVRTRGRRRPVPRPPGGRAPAIPAIRARRRDERLVRAPGTLGACGTSPELRADAPTELQPLDEHVLAEAECAALLGRDVVARLGPGEHPDRVRSRRAVTGAP